MKGNETVYQVGVKNIVEWQGLHQDDINSLSCSALKTPIVIAHVHGML